MKNSAFFCLIIFFYHALNAQNYNDDRYRKAIFTDVTVSSNVQYGAAPVWTIPYNNTDLKMDIYVPTADPIANRPLIIFAHAGAFINGSKTVDDMVAICDSFARKGYVTASLAYRKGFNPLSEGSAERAVYRGVQDAKAAVRYFKEHRQQYNIDTNFIYFGGMSAGAFMALHLAYMDLESERPASSYGSGFLVNDLGCLDCAGNSYTHSSKVRAILNYWGAIQDTTLIQAGDTPILSMHGTTDPSVPFEYDHPFGVPTLPKVYGSKWIDQRVNNLGIYNEFYTSDLPNRHMLDGSDNGTWDPIPSDFWYDTLLPRTTDFLVKMTKSSPQKNSADTLYVCHNNATTLAVSGQGYFRWVNHTNNSLSEFATHTNTLQHTFPTGSHTISVVEFNEVYCSSDTLWFHVVQLPPSDLIADFSYTISDDSLVSFTNQSMNATSYSWDFGDNTSSSEVDPTHIYTESGNYTITLSVQDEYACELLSISKEIEITIPSIETPEPPTGTPEPPNTGGNVASIQEDDWENRISIYPNPFLNELYIDNPFNEPIKIEISDLNGRKILEQSTDQHATILSTQQWNKGVYFVQVIRLNNIHTIKLIKQ